MAKVTGTVVPSALLARFKRTVRLSRRQDKVFARRWFQIPYPDSPEQRAQQAKLAGCVQAWRKLPPWKKTRWTKCAYRNGIPIDPPTGVKWFGGFTLYTREWLKQGITPGSQPISPCSRRMTNPAASPFDWTP